ncbi:hypothetical protein H4R21_003874 [Coemansia helicoidea]|uniref:Uncharacterized protein n=2 Tax=Coemansia TaxID=4863 RepID=A0ACC1L1G0_9FUNG|nr:hypothetical protein H4R21_003874 [Coemansia helicoidea]
MLSTSLLKLLRYSLYLATLVLAAIELIVVSVALAAVSDFDGLTYGSLSPWRGGAAYTLFVTLLTLLTYPFVAFGNILTNRGFHMCARYNMVIYEVVSAVLFTVLWFVAGVVMAHYADGCPSFYSMCGKYKAATAFAWFPFFVFLCNSVVLSLLTHRARKGGAPLTILTYEIDYESGSGPAPAAPQHVESQYQQATKTDASYYGSNPQVSMPVAPSH